MAGRRPAAPLPGVAGSAVGEGDMSGVGAGGEDTGASGAGAAADGVGAVVGVGTGADTGGETGAGVGGGIAGGGVAGVGGGAWGAAAGAVRGACAVAATARSARTERMASGEEAAIAQTFAGFLVARLLLASSALPAV